MSSLAQNWWEGKRSGQDLLFTLLLRVWSCTEELSWEIQTLLQPGSSEKTRDDDNDFKQYFYAGITVEPLAFLSTFLSFLGFSETLGPSLQDFKAQVTPVTCIYPSETPAHPAPEAA